MPNPLSLMKGRAPTGACPYKVHDSAQTVLCQFANVLVNNDEPLYHTVVMYEKPGEPMGGLAIRSSG
jgi:hypothetical protein